MIETIVVALLAASALALVLAPLNRQLRREPTGPVAAADAAVAKKDAALTAIIDLENEREVGKLSQPDFEALRIQYEQEALEALRELETIELATAEDAELEAEIAELRRAMSCQVCGAPRGPGETCPRCGE